MQKHRVLLAVLLLCQSFVGGSSSAEPVELPAPNANNIWYRAVPHADTVIVFVHGLLSDSRACWWNQKYKTYWPDLLANDPTLPRFAIYLGGFYTEVNSGLYDINQAAMELFAALGRQDANGDPPVLARRNIVFVCHSLGGIVVRRVLADQRETFRSKNVGVVLVASPSAGSKYADRLAFFINAYENRMAKDLRLNSVALVELDRRFRDLLRSGSFNNITGVDAAENHFIAKARLVPPADPLVDPRTLIPYFDTPVRIMRGTDHSSVVKPHDRRHPTYELLSDFLKGPFAKLVKERANRPERLLPTALTNDGLTHDLAVARTGDLYAIVRRTTDRPELLVRTFDGSSERKLITERTIDHLAFSNDSTRLYYTTSATDLVRQLKVVDVAGGPSRKVALDVDSRPAFSPDGRRVAYVRGDNQRGFSQLMIRDLAKDDPPAELAKRELPHFFNVVAWHPKEEVLACAVGQRVDLRGATIAFVRTEPNRPSQFLHSRWAAISDVAWTADGRGVYVTATTKPTGPHSIWYVARPKPGAKKDDITLLTPGIVDYRRVAVGEKGVVLALNRVRASQLSRVSLRNGDVKPLPVALPVAGEYGVATNGDDVYFDALDLSGNRRLWRRSGSAGHVQAITDGDEAYPVSCGERIAFTSLRGNMVSVWTARWDGSDRKELASAGVTTSDCSPDGTRIAYLYYALKNTDVAVKAIRVSYFWKMLKMKDAYAAALIGSNGSNVIVRHADEVTFDIVRTSIVALPTGDALEIPIGNAKLRTPLRVLGTDEVAYVGRDENMNENIFAIGLRSPFRLRQITRFTDGEVFSFAAPRTSDSLTASHGRTATDASLMRPAEN